MAALLALALLVLAAMTGWDLLATDWWQVALDVYLLAVGGLVLAARLR